MRQWYEMERAYYTSVKHTFQPKANLYYCKKLLDIHIHTYTEKNVYIFIIYIILETIFLFKRDRQKDVLWS